MSSPDGPANAAGAVLRTILDFVVALPMVGKEDRADQREDCAKLPPYGVPPARR